MAPRTRSPPGSPPVARRGIKRPGDPLHQKKQKTIVHDVANQVVAAREECGLQRRGLIKEKVEEYNAEVDDPMDRITPNQVTKRLQYMKKKEKEREQIKKQQQRRSKTPSTSDDPTGLAIDPILKISLLPDRHPKGTTTEKEQLFKQEVFSKFKDRVTLAFDHYLNEKKEAKASHMPFQKRTFSEIKEAILKHNETTYPFLREDGFSFSEKGARCRIKKGRMADITLGRIASGKTEKARPSLASKTTKATEKKTNMETKTKTTATNTNGTETGAETTAITANRISDANDSETEAEMKSKTKAEAVMGNETETTTTAANTYETAREIKTEAETKTTAPNETTTANENESATVTETKTTNEAGTEGEIETKAITETTIETKNETETTPQIEAETIATTEKKTEAESTTVASIETGKTETATTETEKTETATTEAEKTPKKIP